MVEGGWGGEGAVTFYTPNSSPNIIDPESSMGRGIVEGGVGRGGFKTFALKCAFMIAQLEILKLT